MMQLTRIDRNQRRFISVFFSFSEAIFERELESDRSSCALLRRDT